MRPNIPAVRTEEPEAVGCTWQPGRQPTHLGSVSLAASATDIHTMVSGTCNPQIKFSARQFSKAVSWGWPRTEYQTALPSRIRRTLPYRLQCLRVASICDTCCRQAIASRRCVYTYIHKVSRALFSTLALPQKLYNLMAGERERHKS